MGGLDENLRALTGYQIRRTSSEVLFAVNKILSPFGLRRTTFSTLYVIVENPGLRQSQLAEGLKIERPNLVQLLAVLEKAGLIQRDRNPEDGRAYSLRATEAGQATLQAALAAVQRYEEILLEGLSESEATALRHALETVERNAQGVEVDDDPAV